MSAQLLVLGAGLGAAYAANQPNIFMLLTDDQDITLGGLDGRAHGIPYSGDGANPMPKLKKLLTEQGTTFSNAFVHTPICCPSRSSYMTGKYLHNSGTFENDIAHGCSDPKWVNGPEERAFAAHLKSAGYHTSYSGKYLNQYAMPGSSTTCQKGGDVGCGKHIPKGWDDWHGLHGNSRYYNGTISDNGVNSFHGTEPEDYLPDVFFGHAKAFVAAHLENEAKAGTPFLCVLATPSCHGPFTPAPKYIGHFSTQKAPITPNYNHSNADKQWLMRHLSPLTPNMAKGIDGQHNHRWETLLSVDDYIEEIIDMLEEANEMSNTYFLFTSDHGFQLGQHRLPGDKRHPYEHDIRIPFIIRGPGVKANHTETRIAMSVDVAPTFVAIATGGTVPDDMDGVSLLPLLSAEHPTTTWRTDFMVDYHGQGREPCGLVQCPAPPANNFHLIDSYNNTFKCVRTLSAEEDSQYCEFDDDEHFVEYYKHDTDPWQLTNLAGHTGTAPATLKAKLQAFRTCKGKECRSL